MAETDGFYSQKNETKLRLPVPWSIIVTVKVFEMTDAQLNEMREGAVI